MESTNDVNVVQERCAVEMTSIINNVVEEHTKNYEANGEDDVLKSVTAHKEGHGYEEVRRNGTGGSFGKTVRRSSEVIGQHVVMEEREYIFDNVKRRMVTILMRI